MSQDNRFPKRRVEYARLFAIRAILCCVLFPNFPLYNEFRVEIQFFSRLFIRLPAAAGVGASSFCKLTTIIM